MHKFDVKFKQLQKQKDKLLKKGDVTDQSYMQPEVKLKYNLEGGSGGAEG